MSRIAFALALVVCMVWLTSMGAVEPAGQDKVQDAPAKGAKDDDKAKTDKDKAKVGVEKKVGEAKMMVMPALRIAPAAAVPAQKAKQGKAAPAAAKMAAPVPAFIQLQPADALGQQFLPQFQRVHKGEMHFMRRVCQPTREQFEKIAADSEPALKTIATKFGQMNQNNGFMIVNAGMAENANDQNDPPHQIASAVAKSVRKVLTAEQANKYDQEIAERLESSKRMVVLAYVAKMDKLLHLNASQRDKLVTLLNSKWKYSVNRAQLLNLGGQYFPLMPDKEINELLSEPQKHVWTGIQRGNISFGVSLESQDEENIEEVWDEPSKKPAPAKAKSEDKSSAPVKKVKS